ncbi:hypothetical protein BRC78_05455 [Halobacteriales archaeon QH_8_68_33]|nr:MAG: hypothetical protein BRC78_05455 [Halobacteriales archaeon QH_8_68_33]
MPINIERFERDTAGCKSVKNFAAPGRRISSRSYSRQYESEFGGGETNAERVLESLDSRLGPEDMDEWRAAADEASDS